MMSGLQTAAAVLADLQAPRRAGFALRSPPPVAAAPPACASAADALPCRVRGRVYATDAGAHDVIDASACLRFMDRGRVEAIESQCAESGTASWLERYVVNVYRIDARLDLAARLGDWLEVQTAIRRRSSHRIAFDQRIVHAATGSTVAEATVEVLFLDREGKLATVPTELCGVSPNEREPLVPAPLASRPVDRKLAFKGRYRVYYEDTDAQAIAYHVTYVRFCERALIDLLEEVVAPAASLGQWLETGAVRITRLTTRYLHATRLGDSLAVRFKAHQAPGEAGRVVLDARLGAPDDPAAVSADAQLEVAFVDLEGRPVDVPAPLIAMCEAPR
jgi:acyl-CoA thioester hydrolase